MRTKIAIFAINSHFTPGVNQPEIHTPRVVIAGLYAIRTVERGLSPEYQRVSEKGF